MANEELKEQSKKRAAAFAKANKEAKERLAKMKKEAAERSNNAGAKREAMLRAKSI